MANYREIVTKAVIAKGKKTFTTNEVVVPEITPTTILGCWVINHNFRGYKNNDKIVVEGTYDVNIWYSCLEDSKTEVVKKTTSYVENVSLPVNDNDTSNSEVIIRSLKQPTCTRCEIVNGNIEYTIEKDLGIELVGDTKVKIQYDEEEDPWDILEDEVEEKEAENIAEIIDEEVKEDFLE